MNRLPIRVERLAHAADLPLPRYETSGAAGCDLLAAVDDTRILRPSARDLIPTGLRIALPEGYEAQVRPRSGLALRDGLILPNSPGTIDADYRGEIKVIVLNLGEKPIAIRRGMRIAQMIVVPVLQAEWIEGEDLDETARGTGGFGSTGRG